MAQEFVSHKVINYPCLLGESLLHAPPGTSVTVQDPLDTSASGCMQKGLTQEDPGSQDPLDTSARGCMQKGDSTRRIQTVKIVL